MFSNCRLENSEKKKTSKNEAEIQSSSSFGSSGHQAVINHRMYGRTRSHTVAGSASVSLHKFQLCLRKRKSALLGKSIKLRCSLSHKEFPLSKAIYYKHKYTTLQTVYQLYVT